MTFCRSYCSDSVDLRWTCNVMYSFLQNKDLYTKWNIVNKAFVY